MIPDPDIKPLASGTDLDFTPAIPILLQDIACKADKWGNDGKSGRIDPFTEIYDASRFWHHPFFLDSEFPPPSSFS